jgi:intracellular multiplication protein IcmP
MKGGGQQQQGGAGMDALYIAAFLVIFSGLMWWKFKAQIVSAIFSIRLAEISLIEIFLDMVGDIASWLHLPQPDLASMERWTDFMESADPERVTGSELYQISADVNAYFSVPVFIISVLLGSALFFYHSASMYNNIYNMKKLRYLQSSVYPQYMPIMNQNLIDTGLDEGHWRMSEQPMAWCKANNVLEEYTKDGKLCARVIREAAAGQFCLQMGPIWDARVDTQPPYVQALFAAFAAKAERDSVSSRKLLNQIAQSSLSTKLDFTGTRELLRKHISSKVVGRAAGPHAYVITMMASMLEAARLDGVLATAEFIWLKAVDRRLWYMLNSVGRKTAFPEVAGPFAHWRVEKRLRRPLKVPVVDTAVNAMEEAISQIIYKPDDKDEV